ncbi:hypothetical protein K2173_024075 [Erythroxylum novogranatense]|uniref:ATP phosphoribosyltransferase regulatory subunit n=1 Tax=Erythroxylum novogranatense TaxID=1862640 RepID=A0AAV8TT69_9ROSI|nr:hypothetical protein K2173_024075 [Erythroxylum novogranatense]
MFFNVTLSPPSFSSFCQPHRRRHHSNITLRAFVSCSQLDANLHSLKPPINRFPLQASRRASDFASEGNDFVDDPRNWSRSINSHFVDDEDDEDEDGEDEEEDRSLDLLVRFVQNMFRKISKRARKAVRSVLPASISTKLVGFSVNGVLILTLLWIAKAFLEVVCTLGSVVFMSILLVRGVWAGITYLQGSRSLKMNELEDDQRAWNGTQPAT